jgi:preprotein translocase subunit SecD
MNKWIISLLLSLACPVAAFSFESNIQDYYLAFEIVQDQFIFDKATIKSAAIHVSSGGMYQGLRLKLKPAAAEIFARMTTAGINKNVNLVFNKKIVSTTILKTSLGNDLLITGISKNDAQEFINRLSNFQPNKI